jgi:hypothetical protein
MKYDDVSWHSGGEFPADLTDEAGATHIGMFIAWAFLNGLEGNLHKEGSATSLQAVKERQITGAEFLLKECDWKFTDNDLNDEGNAFALFYYGNDEGYGAYLGDYEKTLGSPGTSLYYVKNSWENFEKLSPVITARYAAWKSLRG